MDTCTGPECTKPATKRGLCSGHYAQKYRYGVELRPLRERHPHHENGEEEVKWMLSTTKKQGECMIWTKNKSADGYGKYRSRFHSTRRAHRIVAAVTHGPSVMPVHHTCANALCINPAHLQYVHERENIAEMKERNAYLSYIQVLEDLVTELGGQLPETRY